MYVGPFNRQLWHHWSQNSRKKNEALLGRRKQLPAAAPNKTKRLREEPDFFLVFCPFHSSRFLQQQLGLLHLHGSGLELFFQCKVSLTELQVDCHPPERKWSVLQLFSCMCRPGIKAATLWIWLRSDSFVTEMRRIKASQPRATMNNISTSEAIHFHVKTRPLNIGRETTVFSV